MTVVVSTRSCRVSLPCRVGLRLWAEGARVYIVYWPADGEVAYAGTVIDLRSRGRALRVELDVGAGRARLRCHTVKIDEVWIL